MTVGFTIGGIAAAGCGTILAISPDNEPAAATDGASRDAIADGLDLGLDGSSDNADAYGSSLDAAGSDASVTSCMGLPAGTSCGDDGGVCFDDGSCQACLGNSAGACSTSSQCCSQHCKSLGASFGQCATAGACVLHDAPCGSGPGPCCLPYKCRPSATVATCQ